VALCNVFAVCCNLRVVDRVRVCVCGRVILQWLSLVSMCGRGRARRRITYHARDYRLIDLLLARQETTGEWYPKPVASHLTVTVNKWGATRNNQSIKINSINKKKKKILSKRHMSTREATSQRNHTGSKTRDAKRRRLGGLRARVAQAC